jgi:hypothetical protein
LLLLLLLLVCSFAFCFFFFSIGRLEITAQATHLTTISVPVIDLEVTCS